MTVEELLNMILENIERNGYANYEKDNEFTAIIIDNYIDIMRLANESNEQLIGIISKDRKNVYFIKIIKYLSNMVLEDIIENGHAHYYNGYAIRMAEHYHEIIRIFEEKGDKLFGKISTGIDEHNNVIIEQVSFARNREDLPN